ncbi:YncE family protein [Catenulispora rubra]|uniref:YncE family protein n=1 Tax=Catenulispora rubra TaxID=280293 RepID=UPI0018927994|nr:YncE family protein [Catenulispora rubra]
MPRRLQRLTRILAAAGLTAAGLTATSLTAAPGASADTGLRDVLVVGNSQAGTVSVIDGHTFANLGSINVIPDLSQRMFEIYINPIWLAGYEIVRAVEGGDRYVDDATVSPDGRTLYVSRGNLDDVAAFDLTTHAELWHTRLDGFHADHAALSPDGTRYVVSATTAQEAEVFNTATGTVVGTFATGTYPHQNDYSADGKYIYNSSIGTVSLPQSLEWAKGSFQLTKVDASTLQVVKTWTFPHGIRPNEIAPDGHTFYADLSYLNGFVKYDLNTSKILNTVQMPYASGGTTMKPDDYPKNSAHHGLALNGDGSKLCDVGTIDDYTAIVSTSDLSTSGMVNYPSGALPYWGQTSADGQYCFVSLSHLGQVSVVDYATATEVARVPVGTFPQRERISQMAPAAVSALDPAAG